MTDFIEIWNQATSVQEVCDKMGKSYAQVTRHAWKLRKQGYKVKRMLPPKEHYVRIGTLGGKASRNGGFGAGEEGRKRASYYGRIGGLRSRRRKA